LVILKQNLMKQNLTIALVIFGFNSLFAQDFSIGKLIIPWPKEFNWIISTQKEEDMETMQLVSNADNPKSWIMGVMTVAKGIDPSMNGAMQESYRSSMIEAPKSVLKYIESDTLSKIKWIIFTIESPRFLNDPIPESQLYYLVKFNKNLYGNFVAIKQNRLTPEFINKWKAIFKGSRIKN
jgi:hypothetical protein